MEGVVFAISNAIGFGLALTLFPGIREHLDLQNIPKGLKGIPIALITAGILAMALCDFQDWCILLEYIQNKYRKLFY